MKQCWQNMCLRLTYISTTYQFNIIMPIMADLLTMTLFRPCQKKGKTLPYCGVQEYNYTMPKQDGLVQLICAYGHAHS
eukprot:5992222-Ditylum_brightwellii.AAC.1